MERVTNEHEKEQIEKRRPSWHDEKSDTKNQTAEKMMQGRKHEGENAREIESSYKSQARD